LQVSVGGSGGLKKAREGAGAKGRKLHKQVGARSEVLSDHEGGGKIYKKRLGGRLEEHAWGGGGGCIWLYHRKKKKKIGPPSESGRKT